MHANQEKIALNRTDATFTLILIRQLIATDRDSQCRYMCMCADCIRTHNVNYGSFDMFVSIYNRMRTHCASVVTSAYICRA